MRYVELRRHSLRVRPSDHLSQEGVTLARGIGATMGPFARVITSPALRCIETAVAMGFAVTSLYQHADFSPEEYKALDAVLPEGTSFARRAQVMRTDPLAVRYARALYEQWAAVAAGLADGESALVISHGGYLDDSAVICVPDADYETWGPDFGHCEGARLAYDGQRFVGGELLRLC